MKLLVIASMMISMAVITCSHPVMMVILIIAQSLIVSLALFMYMAMSWYSYVLFLIFLGGLMVLFVYICSVASNEKIHPLGMGFWMISLLMSMSFALLSHQEFSSINMSLAKYLLTMLSNMSMSIMIITMFFLLFTLIVVVNLSDKKSGPLRAKKK